MPSKYFEVRGIATFLRHTGPTTLPESPPDLSRGEVVLCLHHAGGNSRNFDALSAHLAGEDAPHSPVAFDLPGHDRTASLESLASIEKMAAHASALLDVLEPGRPVVLLGHGLGGAVAMQLALDHPERVAALVLCGAGVGYPCPDDLIDRARLVSEGKARREFAVEAFAKGTSREIFQAGYMDTLKTDPRVIHPNLVAHRDWPGASRVSELAMPMLLCVGDQELAPIVEQVDALAAAAPNARKREIAEAGHMLPLEQPAALASAVADFLGELP